MAPPLVLLLVLGLAAVRLAAGPLPLDALGSLAALLVAASLAPGDPPRRPWLLRGVALGLVLVAHALQRTGLVAGLRVDYLLLLAANLLGAAAMLGFLQILRASGLAEPLTRGEVALTALALGAVLGLVVWQLAALDGVSLRSATLGVSTLTDAWGFMIALLLLRIVLPMRGGRIAVPYLLLAVDGLAYLLVDLALAIDLPALAPAVAPLGALAGAAGAAAGLAQLALARRPAPG